MTEKPEDKKPKDRLNGKKTLNKGFLEELEADEIKKKVALADVLERFGVKLEQKGSSLVGLCPFHDEKTPSFSVTPEKGVYHCFGCNESGDVFTFVEKMKGLSFKEALKYLAGKEYVSELARNSAEKPVSQPPVVVEPPPVEPSPVELPPGRLTEVVDWWQKKLQENREAREYLEGRGFTDASLWTRFKIGYADGSLPSVLSEEQKRELTAAGVLTKKGMEHFYGCVVFPMLDEAERVTGIYGRKIDESASIWHLYLKGQHKGVFNRKASKVYDEIILTESLIDALSLIYLGFENVQALYGVNGFTGEHKKVLQDDRVKTIILAFDNDTAGKEGAEKYTPELVEQGFTVKVIAPPLFKDWNECLQQNLTKETVQNLIAEAPPFMPKEAAYRLTVEQGRHRFDFGDISYVLLGVPELFVGNLKVSVRAIRNEETFYDNLEFFSARSRTTYANGLARAFGCEPKRVERDLLEMLKKLETERDKKLSRGAEPEAVKLTEEEKALGLSFLQSPTLLDDICRDMETLGYVGEDVNKKLMYLAASSRKLDDPFSVLIVSESASGKSLLIETVRKLLPPDEVRALTSLSDQALNYADEKDLLHVFLILCEAVHSEVVEHQIREMLSARELTRFVVTKDEDTGKLTTSIIRKQVVVSLAMSTTNWRINPENASRCFVINTDESREQTKHVHEAQRMKYSAERYFIRKHDIPRIIAKHRAAQRLLTNRVIVNPYAAHLDFPDGQMRTRRDNDRFLDLIAGVCFLRQYQKETKTLTDPVTGEQQEYIECDGEDYRTAYGIMEKILTATLAELTAGEVGLYGRIRELARSRAEADGIKAAEVILIQREIREACGCGQEWLKVHLRKLCELEYVMRASGGVRGARNGYRLREDEELSRLDLSNLLTPDELEKRLRGKR